MAKKYKPSPFDEDPSGPTEPGNIDLINRPRVKNADGSISTVRSMGVNVDGQEVLIPTVSEDGRIMSDDEAVNQYKKTGRHLGKFGSVAASNAYAQRLHEDQAKLIEKPVSKYKPSPFDAEPSSDGPAYNAAKLNKREIQARPGTGLTGEIEDREAATGLAGLITGQPQVDKSTSAARGAVQGASYGFGDEIAAAVDTGVSKVPGLREFAQMLHGDNLPIDDPSLTYSQRRDAYRAKNEQAQQANPKTYIAGELAGGLAAPIPGGAAVKGATAGAKIASVAKTGAKVGAAAGLGMSKADLTQGEYGKAATDTAIGAATGAVVAPVIHGAGKAVGAALDFVNPKAAEAAKSAQRWIAKEIGGEVRGASTATARKQLADDAQNVSRIVLKDKGLREAIDNATEQSVEHLEHANGVVADRLSTVNKKLSPNWGKIDTALGEAAPTSGQVIGAVEENVAKLRATGRTSDAAEADALEAIAGRLKKAKDWGAGSQVASKLSEDAQAAVAQLEKLSKAASPETAAKLQGKIAEIKNSATAEGFDSNKRIPMEQLQRLWSDEAGIAYNSMGGINGTPTFERKLDVASHLRTIRDEFIGKAAAKDPKTVAAMKEDLSHYSALKRVEKVLDMRTNHAKAIGGGASVPAEFARRLKEFKHSPLGAMGGAVIEKGVKFKQGIDTEAALRAIEGTPDPVRARAAWNAIIDSKPGKAGAAIAKGVAEGIPYLLAIQAAKAVGNATNGR